MMMNTMQQDTLQQHRRGRSVSSSTIFGNEREEDLVLFHEVEKRERASVYPSVVQSLQRDPCTSASPRTSAGADDIFTSSEWDKNDYDWLLTPPSTPFMPNIDHEAAGNGLSLSGVASAGSLLKTTSRLGVSRSEPPSRAEPTSQIARGTQGIRQPANATAVLSTSTNSAPRRTLSSSRPYMPSSIVNARPSTPSISQPLARPSTPSRSAGAPRVSSSTVSTSGRASTPTGRSSTIPSNRAGGSIGPSTTTSASRPASSSILVPSNRPASSSILVPSNRPASSSLPYSITTSTRPGNSAVQSATAPTRPVSSFGRATTPVKRPATPTRTTNPPITVTRSSSVSKATPMPSSKTAAMSRPSSPASRVRQPAAHPAILPEFSQEPPPNLRTSMPDRPLSNSRGSVASRAGGAARSAQPDVRNDGARSLRLSSSPLVSRGRVSSDSVISDKSISRSGNSYDASPASLSSGFYNKMVDRSVPARKPLVFSEKQSTVLSLQDKKLIRSSPVRTVPAVRESSGFGRNLSRKSLDMALRHMDIRKNTQSGYKSFMSNVPASSLFSVSSSNGRGVSGSSVAHSPMATSSNASSEHSMGIAIDRDREGSEIGDEMLSEKGSKASSIGQVDSYNERRVNSWLGSPHYANGNNTDILQEFEQGIERLSSTESPLISPYEGKVGCENFTLEPIH